MPFSTVAAADRYPLLSRSDTPKPLRDFSIGIAILLILSADTFGRFADYDRGLLFPEQPCAAEVMQMRWRSRSTRV